MSVRQPRTIPVRNKCLRSCSGSQHSAGLSPLRCPYRTGPDPFSTPKQEAEHAPCVAPPAPSMPAWCAFTANRREGDSALGQLTSTRVRTAYESQRGSLPPCAPPQDPGSRSWVLVNGGATGSRSAFRANLITSRMSWNLRGDSRLAHRAMVSNLPWTDLTEGTEQDNG